MNETSLWDRMLESCTYKGVKMEKDWSVWKITC